MGSNLAKAMVWLKYKRLLVLLLLLLLLIVLVVLSVDKALFEPKRLPADNDDAMDGERLAAK